MIDVAIVNIDDIPCIFIDVYDNTGISSIYSLYNRIFLIGFGFYNIWMASINVEFCNINTSTEFIGISSENRHINGTSIFFYVENSNPITNDCSWLKTRYRCRFVYWDFMLDSTTVMGFHMSYIWYF